MNLLLIAAAVVPAAFLMLRVYQADKLEREPADLLWSLVILGVASTSLASFTEQLGDILLSWFVPDESLPYNIVMYFVIVALSEEGFKYLLLKKRTWRSPHFNCRFDGVVYAVFISLGFALWENISYVLSYGFGVAVARALTAVPGHACFGVFMGTWYGVAKRYELAGMPEESRRARRMALLLPTLLHGAYDFIAAIQEEALGMVFVVFIAALFIVSLRLVRKQAREDEYLYEDPVDMDL
ncbi:MAG: PrsW family intramembrane metalloprotease [Oscillospiraceae bacterium]|nr:PrsW family intramembrane metalloprotease [Oscillospiraceae bacterium]